GPPCSTTKPLGRYILSAPLLRSKLRDRLAQSPAAMSWRSLAPPFLQRGRASRSSRRAEPVSSASRGTEASRLRSFAFQLLLLESVTGSVPGCAALLATRVTGGHGRTQQ